MNGCYRKMKRYASSGNILGCLAVFLIFCWFFGLTDHLHSKSFDDFQWPSADDNFEFPTFLTPVKCEKRLLVLVKSAVKNIEHRNAIRETWGKENKNYDLFFIVGKGNSEFSKDILKLDIIDSYRNNTLKFFGAINFIKTCGNPDFIFLVDDDYLVNIKNLENLVKFKNPGAHLYTGFVFNSSPFRFNLHKHRISLEEYPYSQYPPYVSAGAVLISRKTASVFHENIPKLKTFPFDDVFTGILAKTARIPVTHNPNFVFWTHQISQIEYNSPDFIGVHGFAGQKLRDEYQQLINYRK
ncbi:unnamed protein product [Caenorhabditis angaria]|uniref:Hexosyltransferase n=1 Tax=Caenorhabditis angaria TaxID=860376 RepID=A0A9P1IL48_9PELO|nr:unnamed protein product [Caenorhabditis angaria]